MSDISLITRQKGFSLLEVLVAFTVLALSLGVLFQLFSTAVRGVLQSEHYTRALIIAESRLALLGREEPLEQGQKEGIEADIYRWRAEVTPYVDGEATSELMRVEPYQVSVHVGWDEAEASYPVELTTLRFNFKQ